MFSLLTSTLRSACCLCFQTETFSLCWEDAAVLLYWTNWEVVCVVISRWWVSIWFCELLALWEVLFCLLHGVSVLIARSQGCVLKLLEREWKMLATVPRALASSLWGACFPIIQYSQNFCKLHWEGMISFCWPVRMGPELQLGSGPAAEQYL